MTAKILPFSEATSPAPTIVNATVPRRPPNSELRTREHLTESEIDALMSAAHKTDLPPIAIPAKLRESEVIVQ